MNKNALMRPLLLAALSLLPYYGSANTSAPLSPVVAGGGGGTPSPTVVPTQMRSWMFAPNRVNFSSTGGSPTVTAVPNAPGNNNLTAAAYDEANNLLFYADVNTGNLYSANGISVGVMNSYVSPNLNSESGPGPLVYYKEGFNSMAVVPVPGACNRFYLITTQDAQYHHVLVYCEVDCSGSAPVISRQTQLLGLYGGTSLGIAVSKMRNGSVRDLYHTSGTPGLVHYVISNTGISTGTTEVSGPIGGNGFTGELDLSPDGQYLAWASNQYAYRLRRSPVTGVIDNTPPVVYTPLFPSGGNMLAVGQEFSPDSKKLFVSGRDVSSSINTGGIIAIDIATGQSTFVTGSDACYATQLELAYDGLIYGVGGSVANGRLYAINPSALTCSASAANLPLNTTTPGSPRGYIAHRLPNQIDGEVYQYFNGVAAAALSIPLVDGLSLVPNFARNTYNCNPLALSATTTNAQAVRVTVTSALADGTLTNAYTANTGWTSTLPSSLTSLLSGRTGYFQVLVEARNACGQTVQRSGLIQVSSLTPSSTVLEFNGCNGGAQTPSNDPNNPTIVGQYGASIGISNSSGDYDSYQALFEQWVGSGYQQLGNQTAPIAKTSGNLAAIPLSGLANQAGLGSNYFTPGNPGSDMTVRLVITLTNACGSSMATGIFKPMDTACRGSVAEATASPTDARITFFPNPLANERGRIEYMISKDQPVSLTLINALTGQVRLTLLTGAVQSAGTHRLEFDASSLPQGLYFYRLVTDQVTTGRLAKAE